MTKIDKQTEKDFLKAENFRNKNENNEAIKILKKIIKKEPKFPPFLNSIALSYANLKNFEKAENYFLECMKIEPVPLICINNFGKFYYNFEYYLKALPLLKKSLNLNPQQIQIVEITGACLFEAGLNKEAGVFYNEMLKKFPNNKMIKYFHGKNLLRLNKHQEGLESIKETSGVIEFGEKKFRID